jgi:hypothetical protein
VPERQHLLDPIRANLHPDRGGARRKRASEIFVGLRPSAILNQCLLDGDWSLSNSRTALLGAPPIGYATGIAK